MTRPVLSLGPESFAGNPVFPFGETLVRLLSRGVSVLRYLVPERFPGRLLLRRRHSADSPAARHQRGNCTSDVRTVPVFVRSNTLQPRGPPLRRRRIGSDRPAILLRVQSCRRADPVIAFDAPTKSVKRVV